METKFCTTPTCPRLAVTGKKYCNSCAKYNPELIDKPVDDNPYKFKSQIELFKYCWETQAHKCFVTEEKLDRFNGGPLFLSIFAHVLRKSAYPEVRLSPKNIVLLCPNYQSYSVHRLFDDGDFDEILKFEKLSGKSFNKLFEHERQCRENYEQTFKKKMPERRITAKVLER